MTGYEQGILLASGTKTGDPLPRLDEITDWKGFCRGWIEINGAVFPAENFAGFRISGTEDVLTAIMPHLPIKPKKLEKIGTTYCINIPSPAEAGELLRYFDEMPQNPAVWDKFYRRVREINGTRPVPIMPGDRFGKLTVIAKADDKMRECGEKICSRWLCKCDCGNMTTTDSVSLRAGSARSCGCLKVGYPQTPRRKKRVCPVCGRTFEVPVSSSHRTCSPECAKKMHKKWRAMSADGDIYELADLSRWARKHNFLFNDSVRNIRNGFNAIRYLAEFPDGDRPARSYHYRGWTYLQTDAGNPRPSGTRGRPRRIKRTCAVCGKEFKVKSSESTPACSPECAEKFEKSRWALRSEDGDMYEFYDLPRWARKHYMLFEPDADDAAAAAVRIARGIADGRYPEWAIEREGKKDE